MCAAVLHDGVFYQGLCHSTAILLAVNVSGIKPVGGGDCQGFWTSFNRYVNRREAMRIAIQAGQVSAGSKEELFSEDPY